MLRFEVFGKTGICLELFVTRACLAFKRLIICVGVKMVAQMMADAKRFNTALNGASERLFATVDSKMLPQVTASREYFRAIFTVERIAIVYPQMRLQSVESVEAFGAWLNLAFVRFFLGVHPEVNLECVRSEEVLLAVILVARERVLSRMSLLVSLQVACGRVRPEASLYLAGILLGNLIIVALMLVKDFVHFC